MGKLLLIAGVLIVAIIAVVFVLGLGKMLLDNRQIAHKRGLTDSRKRIKTLESENAQLTRALTEIRELASSSEIVIGDPLWSVVIDKADEALEEEK